MGLSYQTVVGYGVSITWDEADKVLENSPKGVEAFPVGDNKYMLVVSASRKVMDACNAPQVYFLEPFAMMHSMSDYDEILRNVCQELGLDFIGKPTWFAGIVVW